MADALLVRAAQRSDLSAVDALFARSYPILLKPDYPPSVLVTVLPRISRAQPHLLASGTYFLAEAPDGAILGAGGWTAGRPTDGRRGGALGHVRHVVTDHRHTRKGIGRALMQASFASARSHGMTALEALSTRTAVPFYAALGFAGGDAVEVDIGAGVPFPAIRMRKTL